MPDNARWKRRPAGSTWGDWGPDDQLGRLNLLTPYKVLKAVAEVKEGRTFCLSIPLDYPGGTIVNPRRHPPRLTANKRQGMPYIAYPLNREDPRYLDVICDDIVEMTLQYSTQWDSLAHVGQLFDADGAGKPEIVFYNGYRAGEHIIGPMDYRDGQAIARGEHVGALRPGPRRDDRPRAPLRSRRELCGLRPADADHGGGQGRGRGGRPRLLPHRLRPGHSRHEQGARRGSARRQPRGRARRSRRAIVELDHQIGRCRTDFRQSRGRADAVTTVRGRGLLRLAAAARPLPVQARRLSRRDLAPLRARRLAARPWSLALPVDRTAAPLARRRRFAGQCNRDGVAICRQLSTAIATGGRKSRHTDSAWCSSLSRKRWNKASSCWREASRTGSTLWVTA